MARPTSNTMSRMTVRHCDGANDNITTAVEYTQNSPRRGRLVRKFPYPRSSAEVSLAGPYGSCCRMTSSTSDNPGHSCICVRSNAWCLTSHTDVTPHHALAGVQQGLSIGALSHDAVPKTLTWSLPSPRVSSGGLPCAPAAAPAAVALPSAAAGLLSSPRPCFRRRT